MKLGPTATLHPPPGLERPRDSPRLRPPPLLDSPMGTTRIDAQDLAVADSSPRTPIFGWTDEMDLSASSSGASCGSTRRDSDVSRNGDANR